MNAIRRSGFSGLARILCLLVLVGGVALADTAPPAGMPPFPRLTGPVVDNAGLLPEATRNTLAQQLANYAQQTGNQLVVVTLPSLDGYPIDSYGYQLGRHWGIGQKGKDNGVLLIIDAKEHQMRIEVGYGLEGRLTDAASSEIIRNVIAPRFRAGDYPGGILSGVKAILVTIGGSSAAVTGGNEAPPPAHRAGISGFTLLLMFFAFSVLLSGMRGRRGGQGFWMGIMIGLLSGGGFGGGGSGGGFGGGSGFSGGGGSFGGGGASGGW